MALLDFFLSNKQKTANIAKERLRIVVTEQRKNNNEPHYFPKLKNELLQVISKYMKIKSDIVTVQIDQKNEDISVLELNIVIPD